MCHVSSKVRRNRGTKTQHAITPILTETRGTMSCGTSVAKKAETMIIITPTILVIFNTTSSDVSGLKYFSMSEVRDVVVTSYDSAHCGHCG